MKDDIVITTAQPCNIKDWTLCLLGGMIVVGFFFINYLVLTRQVTPDNDTNVTTILNYTNSLVIFVAGYFFGASKASGDKDKAIADMASAGVGTGNGQPTTTTTTITPDKTVVKNEPTKPVSPEPPLQTSEKPLDSPPA